MARPLFIANDVLRWARHIFDYAIKRHLVQYNPVAAFDFPNTGGKEVAQERTLLWDELVWLFEIMQNSLHRLGHVQPTSPRGYTTA